MKDTILLFDIDYTLFDTESFKKSNFTKYKLFPQVKKVLKSMNKKFTLGILSQGEHDFQINKLKKSKIYELFNKEYIFIVLDKNNELVDIMNLLKNKKVLFVEDKIEILNRAKKLDPNIITVWFKNGPYAKKTKSKFIPDFAIYKFFELITISERFAS